MSASSKKLIVIAAFAAAVAAYWFLLLAPKREEAASLADQVATKQAAVDAAQASLASYEQARASYKGNYSTLVRLGKAVPGDDDVRSLMVQLNTAANRSNVDFHSIQVGGSSAENGGSTSAGATPPPGAQTVGAAGFWVMPFQFSFGGDFANLSGFFARLERFVTVSEQDVNATGRLLRVESIHLAPESADATSLRAEIGASSYLVPPTEGVTGGGTPAGPAPTTTASGTPTTPSTTPPTTSATTTGALR